MLLIDPPLWPAHGRRWSHLVSDSSFAELHAFASAQQIPARGFEGDHYDVPEDRYPALVAAGAVPVSTRELLRRLQAGGLRRPKRRGERVLASREREGRRVDTVLSRKPPLPPVTRVHLVVRSGLEVLVALDGDGFVLPSVTPAAGEPDADAARRLGTALLGFEDLPSQRLGYLRTVRIAASRQATLSAAQAEVVLMSARPAADVGLGTSGLTGVPGTPRSRGSSPLQWVEATDAAALLPAEVAPFVHGPFAATPTPSSR